MSIRSSAALPLLTVLAFTLTACIRSETPTEPGVRFGTSGTVHVVGQNASTQSIGLLRFVPGSNFLPAVEVRPGESVEMMRWNARVLGSAFIVTRYAATWPQFIPAATVEYKVNSVPMSPSDEVSATVRVTLDSSGVVTAASDRPDVVEIVCVDPPPVPPV